MTILKLSFYFIIQLPVGVAFWMKEMNVRIVQHNLRVVSQYYQRIGTVRLATMVGLTTDALEASLSKLSEQSTAEGSTVGTGGFYVKIDRPAGIVNFKAPREPESVLSDWAGDVSKMLSLMETTCHLINRETMVYKV